MHKSNGAGKTCLLLSAGSVSYKCYCNDGCLWCWWLAMWGRVCVFFGRGLKQEKRHVWVFEVTSHRPWLESITIISNASFAAKSLMHYAVRVCACARAHIRQVVHHWDNKALVLTSFTSHCHSLFPFFWKSQGFLCQLPSNVLLFGFAHFNPFYRSDTRPLHVVMCQLTNPAFVFPPLQPLSV